MCHFSMSIHPDSLQANLLVKEGSSEVVSCVHNMVTNWLIPFLWFFWIWFYRSFNVRTWQDRFFLEISGLIKLNSKQPQGFCFIIEIFVIDFCSGYSFGQDVN